MRFDLDKDGKFELIAREGGWDLIVKDGGEKVFYCHHPVEAVAYMSEHLRESEPADGVAKVVDALARVQKQIEKAVEVINLNRFASELAPALSEFICLDPTGPRREYIRRFSLKMAGCTEQELRVREDREEIVTKAKAVLEPFFQIQGM